ncbi:MAG: FHA domain-containing protein [Desulfobacteraceae bacterium]|jgi:hypothetical protein
MSLLGLELSDAGILVAGSQPLRLIETDGNDIESSGFALAEKNRLLVGKAAEKKAHIFPRMVISHFWDQLNTDPLDHPGPYTQQNHAEIAYVHLSRIWQTIQPHGEELIVAVPGYYSRDQLGLLLGIAKELSLPIRGFVPQALAASATRCPDRALFHLDIHLHRIEITFLNQAQHLTIADSVSIPEKGLAYLYRAWVESIAAEFVRTTRFDPLHQAKLEQELYDRLPGILNRLQKSASLEIEMGGNSNTYIVTCTRELLVKKTQPLLMEICRLIEGLLVKRRMVNQAVAVQISHRLVSLPGCGEMLNQFHNAKLIELDRGAAAFGTLQLEDQFAGQERASGISLITRRRWSRPVNNAVAVAPAISQTSQLPTHILYKNLAYRLTAVPLLVGLEIPPGEHGVRIKGQIAGISRKHCSIERGATEVVLKDFSTYGTYVDETRVNGSVRLTIGQIIRVGTPGETLQLIAIAEPDET